MGANPLKGSRDFDLSQAMRVVAQAPAQSFQRMRESLPRLRPDNLPFVDAVADLSQTIMVFDHSENFDAVWQMARLSHRIDKLRDALAYVTYALDMQPENARVAARRAEILLDLETETPGRGYADEALRAAAYAYILEESDFTKRLLERAGFYEQGDDPGEQLIQVIA